MMNDTVTIRAGKPFAIEMDKGDYFILPSNDGLVRYDVYSVDHPERIRITKSENGLNILAGDSVHRLKMRIYVPRDVFVKVSLKNGNLDFSGLQNGVEARIVNGYLIFTPFENPQQQYAIDLKIASGVLVYNVGETSSEISTEVKIGQTENHAGCPITLFEKIGYTGEKKNLQCDSTPAQRQKVRLSVENGTIVVEK